VSDDYKTVGGHKVKAKKTDLEKRLTDEEVEILLSSITWDTHKSFWKRNKAVVQFLLHTALRIGEVANLKLSDVLQIDGKVKTMLDVRAAIAKRQKARHVPLNKKAQEAIKILVEERPEAYMDSALVVKKNGNPLSRRALQGIVTTSGLKAGLNRLIGPHTLRHTCLSGLYEKTKNIKVVQTIAGHSKAQLTIDLYTHATMEGLSKAMDTLDDEDSEDGN